jgi:hypothetical protein
VKTANETAVSEKSKFAHAVRFLIQTSRLIAAKVKQQEATMDQTMVIRLICA